MNANRMMTSNARLRKEGMEGNVAEVWLSDGRQPGTSASASCKLLSPVRLDFKLRQQFDSFQIDLDAWSLPVV